MWTRLLLSSLSLLTPKCLFYISKPCLSCFLVTSQNRLQNAVFVAGRQSRRAVLAAITIS